MNKMKFKFISKPLSWEVITKITQFPEAAVDPIFFRRKKERDNKTKIYLNK